MNKSSYLYSILSFISFYLVYISTNSLFAVFSIIILMASSISLLAYLESIFRTRKTDIISIAAFVIFSLFLILLSMNSEGLSKIGIGINERNMQSWWMPVYIILIFLPVYVLYKNRQDNKPLYIPLLIFTFVPAVIIGGFIAFLPDLREQAVSFAANLIQVGFIDALGQAKNSGVTLPESYLDMLSFVTINKMDIAKKMIYMIPSGIGAVFALVVYITDRLKPLFKFNLIIIREFRLPDNLVWFLIAGGFLFVTKKEGLEYFSYNILILFSVLYFFQGIQIINRAFEYFRLSFFMRSLFFLFIVFYFQIFAVGVVLIGLFSIWYKPKWLTGTIEDDNKNNNDQSKE